MKLLGVVVGTLFLMGCAATAQSSGVTVDGNAKTHANTSSHMANQTPIDPESGLSSTPMGFAHW